MVRWLVFNEPHSVQGAVRVHETELSYSVVRVANLTEMTLDSATGPFRSDGFLH
jgi:hypothetical protein